MCSYMYLAKEAVNRSEFMYLNHFTVITCFDELGRLKAAAH